MTKYLIGSSFEVRIDYSIMPYEWKTIEAEDNLTAEIEAARLWGDKAWSIKWTEKREEKERIFHSKYMRKYS